MPACALREGKGFMGITMQAARRPSARTEDFADAPGANSRIDEIFVPQMKDMHAFEVAGGGERECGRYWSIDPAYGRGAYWCLAMDDAAAIAVFDLTFEETVSFGSVVPNFFCFGSYGRNMIPYFSELIGVEDGWESGTLLGYAWRAGMCREVVPPNKRLVVASISLLPDGATEVARAIGTDPITLTTAIARLDGTLRIPALSRLFDEIKIARPSRTVAKAYYRCKLVEACALVVDWHERNTSSAAPRMRAVDRTSLNLACAFAREHLGDPIELDDLCRAACTSPSKLASLFRAAEGATPMGWVRERRMEHACELLSNTESPIAEVAARVGFARQGSFSEAFKERFGVTPHRYRTLNRTARTHDAR